MTTEAGAEPFIQFGINGVPFSAIRIPFGTNYEEALNEVQLFVDAYTARFGGHVERAAIGQHGAQYVPPQQAPPPPPPPPAPSHGMTGTPAYSQPSGGPPPAMNAVWVYDETGNQVPACPSHKTREGTPRPMKRWPNRWACTAKKQDGSYCSNSVPIGG